MRNLIDFLIRYSTWFVFAFYVLISCVLLFSNMPYQQSVYLTSANAVSASLNKTTAEVTGYFHLKDVNESLQRRNAVLENEVLNLREQLKDYKALAGDTAFSRMSAQQHRFSYILASVINSSTHRQRNYLTINKGEVDGVQSGMGVVDQNGVVGVVNVVSGHTSRVISVLNDLQSVSVKLKGTNYVGTLSWHGTNPEVAYVQDLPRHVKYHIGDSVVTSGYSTTFPEGIPVGTVMSQVRGIDDNYYTVKVKLAANFDKLTSVRVIKDIYKAELDTLALHDLKEENR